jgi:hypothetical protein
MPRRATVFGSFFKKNKTGSTEGLFNELRPRRANVFGSFFKKNKTGSTEGYLTSLSRTGLCFWFFFKKEQN